MKKYVLVDDLDGTEATETVSLGLDGDMYEIDLNEGNAKELRTLFARYATVARPTRKASGKPKIAGPASSNGSVSDSEIRAWAKGKRGVKVSPTGRIPKAVREQYLAAQKS